MHIVLTPSWYPRSETDVDGIFFRLQAQALQRAGFKVGVVAPLFRSPKTEPKTIFTGPYGMEHHRHGGIETYAYHSMYFFPRCPAGDPDRHRWVRAGLKAFAAYVADHGLPDVIHAHTVNYGGILAHTISQRYGIPYIITEHSSTYTRNLIRPQQWPPMRAAVADAADRFAVSRDFCTLLEEKYPGQAWHYLPNILGSNFAQDFAFPEKNRETFHFCSVSHLRHLKGHDLLLPAFAQALQKHPNLRLSIGGDGAEAGRLKQQAADLGLEGKVEFLGALQTEQVLDLMRQSDAFVLASRTETFGVVFIEALSQGLPVIATECGGPQSIVNASNGLLVPTENINALADALVQMYEQRHRYHAPTLRQNCLAEFSEAAIIGKLAEAYAAAKGC